MKLYNTLITLALLLLYTSLCLSQTKIQSAREIQSPFNKNKQSYLIKPTTVERGREIKESPDRCSSDINRKDINVVLPGLPRINDLFHISGTDTFVTDIKIRGTEIWAVSSYGLLYSSDFGTTWIFFDSTQLQGEDMLFALNIYEQHVRVATGYDQWASDSSYSIQTGSGISSTTDNGSNWLHVSQPVDVPGDSIIFYGINDSLWILPITTSEQNVTFDISEHHNVVWIAGWAGGLRKSTDEGYTWQRILLPLDNQYTLQPSDTLWAYAPSDTNHLHKLFKRFDPRLNNNLLAFSVMIEGEDTIWCGTAGGINKSTDGGISWQRYTAQLNRLEGNWVIALHNQHGNGQNVVWAITWKASGLSENFGVCNTTNGGLTWKRALAGKKCYNLSSKEDTLYVSAEDGLYRSINRTEWARYKPLFDTIVYAATVDSINRLWVGLSTGLAHFENRDSLWEILTVVEGSPPHIVSVNMPTSFVRPTSDSTIIDSVRVIVTDPDSVDDVTDVWFTSDRSGQSPFYLSKQESGVFVLVFQINSSALLGVHHWTFYAEDEAGNLSDSVLLTIQIIDAIKELSALPKVFHLDQNYPNPFNPTTRLSFTIAHSSLVTLRVFDIVGKEAATLLNRKKYEIGSYEVPFDASRLASGVYFYRIEAESVDNAAVSFTETKKLLLVR